MRPLVLLIALSACDADREPTMVPRMDFNRIAVELAQPLFWVADSDADGVLDPDEVAVPLGPWEATEAQFVKDGAFTEAFTEAYAAIAAVHSDGYATEGLAPDEAKRRDKVRQELKYGRATLVLTDMGDASAEDRAVVEHLLAAGRLIDD
ncbi:MAG: hypothetical protein JRI25_20410, partial [Deltaproteobacteria bacterium]|nr:hypothetical protein [Deltaproteobacteria bacterium]